MEKPRNINKVIESAPLEKYGLKYMGAGSENVCFEVEGSKKKLIKVNKCILRGKILQLLNDSKLKDVPISNFTQEENIEEYRKQENDIKEVFGDEHVLDRGVFRKKIPLTKSSIISILGRKEKNFTDQLDENKNYEIEMLIHTQVIAEELKKPKLHQTESYGSDLLTSYDFEKSKNIDEALKKIENIVNSDFLIEKSTSINYDSIIKEITEKIIQYTKNTGLMLDIFGSNNITMFIDENGKPNFHLIDVILPGPLNSWNKNIKDDKELELLRHAYTFYYSIKRLAEKIGITENLKPQDLLYFKGADIPKGDWSSSSF